MFADVPEPETPHITLGEPASLEIAALPNRQFKGAVTHFSGALDPATRTMRTEVDLRNPEEVLRPGMFGDLTINLEDRPDALTLPEADVHRDEAGSFVYTVDQDRAIKKRVVTGIISDGLVEIVKGVGPDDQVVISGENLSNGMPVRVIASADEPARGETR